MSAEIERLIAINEALRAACAAARLSLAAAFAPMGPAPTTLTTPPPAAPGVAWAAGRDEQEHVNGCTLRRYFTELDT